MRFDLSQSIRSQRAASVLKFAFAPSRDSRIASTIERDQMRFWSLLLATVTDVRVTGVRALSHNKQLQRTVTRRRGDGAGAPFHYALAPRITRRRAAAELRL